MRTGSTDVSDVFPPGTPIWTTSSHPWIRIWVVPCYSLQYRQPKPTTKRENTSQKHFITRKSIVSISHLLSVSSISLVLRIQLQRVERFHAYSSNQQLVVVHTWIFGSSPLSLASSSWSAAACLHRLLATSTLGPFLVRLSSVLSLSRVQPHKTQYKTRKVQKQKKVFEVNVPSSSRLAAACFHRLPLAATLGPFVRLSSVLSRV
ncbi:hypothetical protein B0H21DRAFT_505301 [Amylocystis lapponica]|nr:hypothetical protein B0H21DRAFT_505301 [Amylocystis lapponica]